MAVADEIVQRLVSEGVGLRDQQIFISSAAKIPTGSGPYLSIIETGGTGAVRTQNKTATERPTIQLRARASAATAARALLKAAYNALGGEKGLHNVTLSNVFYLSVIARQGPTDTGQDEVGRATFSFNIEIEKQPS